MMSAGSDFEQRQRQPSSDPIGVAIDRLNELYTTAGLAALQVQALPKTRLPRGKDGYGTPSRERISDAHVELAEAIVRIENLEDLVRTQSQRGYFLYEDKERLKKRITGNGVMDRINPRAFAAEQYRQGFFGYLDLFVSDRVVPEHFTALNICGKALEAGTKALITFGTTGYLSKEFLLFFERTTHEARELSRRFIDFAESYLGYLKTTGDVSKDIRVRYEQEQNMLAKAFPHEDDERRLWPIGGTLLVSRCVVKEFRPRYHELFEKHVKYPLKPDKTTQPNLDTDVVNALKRRVRHGGYIIQC